MTNTPPKVMTFSATDPTGGAGLQADLLTLSSLACHPLSITTAITVQDTVGVNALMPVDSQWVNDQARTILEDTEVSVFKLGLLGSADNIAMVAEIITDYPDIPLILNLAYNVHGNEPSSSEAALLSAYTLTASKDKQIISFRENAIIFIDPTINPDGRDRHTNYRNTRKN